MSDDGQILKLRMVSPPSDWVLAFGCPTTWWRFAWARAVGEFCHMFSDWSDYKRIMLVPFKSLFPPLERSHGLNLCHMPDLNQFGRCMSRHRNIVLFTHCDRESRRLEFREGMIHYEELVKFIPREFDGIVDLSVCNPEGLPELIKARAPAASIRATGAKHDAVGWLYFYAHLFLSLGERDCSYAEALLHTTRKFRESELNASFRHISGTYK